MTTISLATSQNFGESLRDVWTDLSPRQKRHILTTLSERELDIFSTWWDGFAHPYQLPPQFATNGNDWATWLLIGGRGAGKTRAGAEWIKAQALGLRPFASRAASHIALIGELTLECGGLWILLIHEFWTGDVQTINALIGATALLIAYWGFRFGVLGVYVSGRTREKLYGSAGQETPGLVGKLVKAVTGRK